MKILIVGSNLSSSSSTSLLSPPGSSLSFRAGHASSGDLFGAGAGSLFGDSPREERFLLNDEQGQGASNQSKAASGSLFDPPSLQWN